jgi:hypothetical protein
MCNSALPSLREAHPVLSVSLMLVLVLLQSTEIQASNSHSQEFPAGPDNFNIVLDEPYDGAIYIRSAHDPIRSGIVDPSGRFTVRFHADCSWPLDRIVEVQLQGQLNWAWINFGSIYVACGRKFSSSLVNVWPAVIEDGRDTFPNTYLKFMAASGGKPVLMNGPNSFGLFAMAADG